MSDPFLSTLFLQKLYRQRQKLMHSAKNLPKSNKEKNNKKQSMISHTLPDKQFYKI